MAAIAVRNVSDEVHGRLRDLAASRGVSVEGLVRVVLAEAVLPKEVDVAAKPTGFADAMTPWPAPHASQSGESGAPELWGALKGSVHVAPGVDLTAPADEAWQADR